MVTGAFIPDERLGIGVVMGDVLVDGSHQFGRAGEYASAQPLGGEVPQESLDPVQPADNHPADVGTFGAFTASEMRRLNYLEGPKNYLENPPQKRSTLNQYR